MQLPMFSFGNIGGVKWNYSLLLSTPISFSKSQKEVSEGLCYLFMSYSFCYSIICDGYDKRKKVAGVLLIKATHPENEVQ